MNNRDNVSRTDHHITARWRRVLPVNNAGLIQFALEREDGSVEPFSMQWRDALAFADTLKIYLDPSREDLRECPALTHQPDLRTKKEPV